jgi:predicted AAA+ superfamily ATPase
METNIYDEREREHMPRASGDRLLQALLDENPWWAGKGVPENWTKPYPRRDFFPLQRRLADPEILAVYGPRQVGKTTLLFQLIESLLRDQGVDPRRILYHSLDHPGLGEVDEDAISAVLETFARVTLKKPLPKNKETLYVFLDEVARVQSWSRTLKGWYDLKYRIKFVISDSSHSLLHEGASRDLVGRLFPQTVLPMKYLDVVGFRSNDREISKSGLDWRRSVVEAIQTGQPATLAKAFKRIAVELAPRRRELLIELDRYLLVDGYPGIAFIDDYREAAARLRAYVDMTFYKDLIRVFRIRNPKGLEDLAALIAAETSQRLNYQGLAANLKIKHETLKDYLEHLESIFLIARSEFYSKSRAKRLRRDKKVYLRNAGLRNAIASELSSELLADPSRLGPLVETVVADHAIRLAFHAGKGPSIAYWQDDRGHEVDIVVETPKRALGIEVKYRHSARGDDVTGLRSFLVEFPRSMGLVVTRDRLELKAGVVFVPLYLFLAIC